MKSQDIFGCINVIPERNLKGKWIDTWAEPQITPLDGRGGGIIAFVSDWNGGDHDIFVMNADGIGVMPITDNNASDPNWK